MPFFEIKPWPPATPRKPDKSSAIMDMDVGSQEHIDMVLRLAKKFYWREIYMRLNEAVPPVGAKTETALSMMMRPFMPKTVAKIKHAALRWSVHGLIATDSRVTDKNPEGNKKAVGFAIYVMDKVETNQLQILFLYVAKPYRNKFHGSTLMKTVQERHLGDAVSGERRFSNYTSTLGFPLVNFITMEVSVGDRVIAFYRTLGFAVASEVPGWDIQAGQASNAEFIIMVDASPRTWVEIRDWGAESSDGKFLGATAAAATAAAATAEAATAAAAAIW